MTYRTLPELLAAVAREAGPLSDSERQRVQELHSARTGTRRVLEAIQADRVRARLLRPLRGSWITARRWRDGKHAYHSVAIHLPDPPPLVRGFTYGGDYLATAWRMLCDAGHAAGNQPTGTELYAWGIKHEVHDVHRRQELHNRGKP